MDSPDVPPPPPVPTPANPPPSDQPLPAPVPVRAAIPVPMPPQYMPPQQHMPFLPANLQQAVFMPPPPVPYPQPAPYIYGGSGAFQPVHQPQFVPPPPPPQPALDPGFMLMLQLVIESMGTTNTRLCNIEQTLIRYISQQPPRRGPRSPMLALYKAWRDHKQLPKLTNHQCWKAINAMTEQEREQIGLVLADAEAEAAEGDAEEPQPSTSHADP
ncbi:hypothetical protein AAVH_26080 [Aphelenchoides avenae]|nr:hypothetical protein AAVH_26080 [Aphelenchus avenae]